MSALNEFSAVSPFCESPEGISQAILKHSREFMYLKNSEKLFENSP